jgi:hypothetical protein
VSPDVAEIDAVNDAIESAAAGFCVHCEQNPWKWRCCSNMEQFIGCDAHKKFSVFVTVNEKGHAGEALRVAHAEISSF